MKKLLCAWVFLVALGVLGFAKDLSFTTPHGGEAWCLNQKKTITWTSVGVTGNIRLMLFRGGTKLGLLKTGGVAATGLPVMSGSYTWNVGEYEGGMAAPGTDYQIRIRVMDGSDYGNDSNGFEIKAAGTCGGSAPFNPGSTPLLGPTLEVLDPTAASVWTAGSRPTVRWKASHSVLYPILIFLVTEDHKSPVAIGSSLPMPHLPSGKRVFEDDWTVGLPDNLNPGKYCVQITSTPDAKGKKLEAYSPPFQVRKLRADLPILPLSAAYRIEPAQVDNRSKSLNITPGDYFGKCSPQPQIGNPGGKVIKYGFQHCWDDDNDYSWRLHRSFVRFDLGGVLDKLKGKGTVRKAAILWTKAGNSPQQCPAAIYCLDAAMNLRDQEWMFGMNFQVFPKHPLTQPLEFVQAAQRWLDDPAKNFGVVFRAPNDEDFKNGNVCVEFGDHLVLELEIDDKPVH